MRIKRPPGLYIRRYKTAAGYQRTLYCVRLLCWDGKRRTFPGTEDYQEAKKMLLDYRQKNREKYDFAYYRKNRVIGSAHPALEGSIGKSADFIFRGADLMSLRRPTVYAWVSAGEIMYIGQSSAGGSRVFASAHHRLVGVRRMDKIYVWTMRSIEEATKLEQRLILELKPKLNYNHRYHRANGTADLTESSHSESDKLR